MQLLATRSYLTSDKWHGQIRVIAYRTLIDKDECDLANDPRGGWQEVDDHTSRSRCDAARVVVGGCTLEDPALPDRPRHVEDWRLGPVSEHAISGAGLSDTRVRIAPDAKAELLRLAGSRPEEVGALCFGSNSRRLVKVLKVVPPGPYAIHERDRYVADVQHDRDAIDRMAAVGLELVACFHTHPSGSGAFSQDDQDSLAAYRSASGLPRLVGILAVHLSHGWELRAFTTRPGVDRDICERSVLRTP